jgi:uncharacterized damage-inducible protein DinB
MDTLEAAMRITDSLLPEYDHEMGTTRKLLERVPESAFAWRPHPRSWSMIELASHLRTLPQWAGTILNDDSFDLAIVPPAGSVQAPGSQAELVASFERNVASTRARLASMSDAELMQTWALKRGGQEMFSVPRVAAFRSFILSHSIHHRGQLSVYLRMNDVPVPSIYGPSADEGF